MAYKSYQNKGDKDLIFAEYFNSEQEVRRSGGVPSGTFTFSQGQVTFTTDGKVTYANPMYGVKSIRLIVELDSTTEDILTLSASHSVEAGAGTITATGVSTPTIYVDGVAGSTIGTSKAEVVITTATAFTADDIISGFVSAYLEGKIELIELWNKKLDSNEVANLYSGSRYIVPQLNRSGLSPILHISASGGVVRNKFSGDTIGGNLVPSTVNTAMAVVKSDPGYVPLFDGSISKIDCGSYADLDGDLTILAIIKPYTFGENNLGVILHNSKLFIGIKDANDRIYVSSDGSRSVLSVVDSIIKNEWHLIAITRTTAGVVNIYIDAILSGNADQDSGTPVAGTSNITVGAKGDDNTRSFDGLISEVKILSGLMSVQEISQFHSSTRHLYK